MIDKLTIEMTVIIVVVIVIPIIIYFVKKWMDEKRLKEGREILTNNDVMEETFHPKNPPKVGETRIVLSPPEMSDIIYTIKSAIHTFAADDVATILIQVRRISTKYEWGNTINTLASAYGVNIIDVLNKNLTQKQKVNFAKWQENLPTYKKIK